MQINKFKKVGKSKYKILFDNTELTLYEDVILKYELLLKKEVDIELIDKLINENIYYDAYYAAVSYIEIKLRNRKEIYEYLSKKEFDDKLIQEVIEKLEDINLINDKMYVEAYVNDKVNLSLDGPFKIKKNLIEFGIDEELIDSYLNTFDGEFWLDRLDKLINKKKSIMKNKSYFMFISKLKNDLYNLGYDKYMIDNKLSLVDYESNAISKDFEKACRKFKNDKNKIISSLMRKGYSYEEIINEVNKKSLE